jgi:hypothetical protein
MDGFLELQDGFMRFSKRQLFGTNTGEWLQYNLIKPWTISVVKLDYGHETKKTKGLLVG